MRVAVVAVLVATVSGCVTLAPDSTDLPSLAPTPPAQPTAIPTSSAQPPVTPTAEPTPRPTIAPTEPPSGTPDPDASPRPTSVDLAPYLTSEITVLNLAASELSVTVTIVATDGPGEYELGTFDLQPEQVTSQAVVATRYRLDFALAEGGDAGVCTIDVADGEQLQFAVIEGGIVLAGNGPEPTTSAEMLVATSSRCAAGDAT